MLISTLNPVSEEIKKLEQQLRNLTHQLALEEEAKPVNVERVFSVSTYEIWNDYVQRQMPEAQRYEVGDTINIQSEERVIAEWKGSQDNFISEGRTQKRLWERLTAWRVPPTQDHRN